MCPGQKGAVVKADMSPRSSTLKDQEQAVLETGVRAEPGPWQQHQNEATRDVQMGIEQRFTKFISER